MIVVSRFRGGDDLRAELEGALALLGGRPGYVDGTVGRNLDDPELWLLTTRWLNVGSYRRALSSYEVKMHAVAVLSRAIDEPSAYEIVGPDGPEGSAPLNEQVPRELG